MTSHDRNRSQYHRRTVRDAQHRAREESDEDVWRKNRDTRLRANASFADKAAGGRAKLKDRRNPCHQREALELHTMRRDRPVPVVYPFGWLLDRHAHVQIVVDQGWPREARNHRKDALERVVFIEAVARILAQGLAESETQAIRLAVIARGLHDTATNLSSALTKGRKLWNSRPQPFGFGGLDWAEDIDYQRKACEAARQRAVRFIKEIVQSGEGDDSAWTYRWANYSNAMLRRELEDFAHRCDITEDLMNRWVGDNPAGWERATILVVLRALSAVFTFAIMNGRIDADVKRLQYGLACADEYFRLRQMPRNCTHNVRADDSEVLDLLVDGGFFKYSRQRQNGQNVRGDEPEVLDLLFDRAIFPGMHRPCRLPSGRRPRMLPCD
jgi:hypothetical protein